MAAAEVPVTLESVSINIHDKAALLRGAKFFATTCMSCHTMRYMAHNKLAQEAGITLDKMPLDQKEWLFGVVPPDLSLIARQRGADWLYTYFHAFYKDDKRPTGFNNLLMPNSVMTNIFAPLQGVQEKLSQEQLMTPLLNAREPHYYQVLSLVRSGSMSPEAFDATTKDLVTFLVYAGDPKAIKRESMGGWVLLYLLLLLGLAFLLKRLIWKSVK